MSMNFSLEKKKLINVSMNSHFLHKTIINFILQPIGVLAPFSIRCSERGHAAIFCPSQNLYVWIRYIFSHL
jgi:hypothetical protein